MKKISIATITAISFVFPSFAGTMAAFEDRGVIVDQNGSVHETTFSDGQYQSTDGAAGTYTFDQNTLCMTLDGSDQSRCFSLPEDKSSGDSFVIELPDGSNVNVTIK